MNEENSDNGASNDDISTDVIKMCQFVERLRCGMDPLKEPLKYGFVCPNAQCAIGLLEVEKYYPGYWTWKRGGLNKVKEIRKSWLKGWPYERR